MDELLFDEFKKYLKITFLQLSFKKYCDVIEPKWGRRYTMNHPNEKLMMNGQNMFTNKYLQKDGYLNEN